MKTERHGDLEIIHPDSEKEWLELRTHDVTSTDVAALFGISPYLTEYELWHRKKSGIVVELEPSDRMRWGVRLQDAIAAGICQDNGWTEFRRKDEYVRLVKLAMGSSFDYEVSVGGEMPLLEIKNVDSLAFKEGWIVDGNSVEAPPHIEIQLQHQMAVAGRKLAYIGALVGGNRVVLIRRERDDAVIAVVESRIQKFWHDIDRNIEPKPDFVKDAEFIRKLYRYSEPGKIVNADEQISKLVTAYERIAREINASEEKKEAVRAEILTVIGDAEKVIGEGFTISTNLVGPKLIEAHERKGFRNFRVNFKKVKNAVTA